MTHPGPTHPGPSGPPAPAPPPRGNGHALPPLGALPTIGQIIRDIERYTAQALAVVDREVDEASMPQDRDTRAKVDFYRTSVGFHLEAVGRELVKLAALPLPAAGSAVPVRFPESHPPRPPVGGEPTPGSAAVFRGAVRESPGGLPAPGAGAHHLPGEDTRLIGSLAVLVTRRAGRHRTAGRRDAEPRQQPQPSFVPRPLG